MQTGNSHFLTAIFLLNLSYLFFKNVFVFIMIFFLSPPKKKKKNLLEMKKKKNIFPLFSSLEREQ